MSRAFMRGLLADATARYGPVPRQFTFGDGIDWQSELVETLLYVELPFWLMTPPGPVDVVWEGIRFTVEICPPWMEVLVGEFTDSRRTCVHEGPRRPGGFKPPEDVRTAPAPQSGTWMERGCKTVLLLTARAHADAFRQLSEGDPPRATLEHETYWASLCESHLPVVNELIQRYRLVTYDYFAYEVSPWDVPIWYLQHVGAGYVAVLVPYKSWDLKPVTVEDGENPGDPSRMTEFEWASRDELAAASGDDATPGEFDLLDARSLMERGDYTGAVRRATTAIEAIAEWALRTELEKLNDPAEADRRLHKTDLDQPGRLRQWRKLAGASVSDAEFDEFETTQHIRHDIVHRARRLTLRERGQAQRAVDTARWLYNKIESKPDRARLRDSRVLKSAGRVGIAMRFPASVSSDGITLGPLLPPPSSAP